MGIKPGINAIEHPVQDRVKLSFAIFDIRALWHSPERQNAQMSKIANDSLIRSGTEHFITVPIWQQWASMGLTTCD